MGRRNRTEVLRPTERIKTDNFGTLGEKIHRMFEALVGGFVGAWEMNVESSADDGDLACEVSEGN